MEKYISGVVDNFLSVNERIEEAAVRVGRNPEEIKLVAVSKTVGIEKIRDAISAGAALFGENYVQDAKKKIEEIGHEVEWHMIGHLQSNKAKQAINLFNMIQSVDRISLAKEIDRRAKQSGKRISILVQINISGEATKSGVEQEHAVSLVSGIANLANVKIEGLMTMPPYSADPEYARKYFRSLKHLREEIEGRKFANVSMKELSMGMTNDFEVAIEEGATIIRVGTAIFGKRE